MDGRKDIQKTDHLSRFLDDQVIRTNPFGRNTSGERAYRRAERLVAAIHILTNHIPAEEPSRVEVRRIGVNLLNSLLALRDEMRVSESPGFRAVQASIRELISLVRVLSISGYVSFQNASVVIEALDELGNFLTASQRSTLSESVTFSRDDLLGSEGLSVRTAMRKASTALSRTPRSKSKSSPEDIKDIKSIKDNTDLTPVSDMEETLNRRSEAILGILKSQGSIGIKDIASNVPEYSEKMVQRELAHLIALGLVKKTGFKRWSKYEFVRKD